MNTGRLATWRRLAVAVPLLAAAGAWAEESRPLRGHDRWVLSLAVSPDGGRLFSGGDDRSLRRWALATAEPIGGPWTFPSAVTAVACHKDGRRIAVGTHDGRVEIRDADGGTTLQRLAGHEEAVTVLCFDPGGNTLASGSADDSLRIWDLRDGSLLHTIRQGNEYDVATAAFRPDGRQIVTGDGESELKVWDAATGDEVMTLRGHEGTVTSVAYSPCGRRLVSASWDGTLRVWDAESGELLQTVRGHEGEVSAVAASPDGARIVSAGEDMTIRVWDARTYEPLRTLSAGKVMCLAISPDGRTLISGGKEAIRLWNLAGPDR